MYVAFKFNRKTKLAGDTYEKVRQLVRKAIRKQGKNNDFFWTSNPMIGDYGYGIRRVV